MGTQIIVATLPDRLTPELELLVEPEELLAVCDQDGEITTVLIKWKGLSTFEARYWFGGRVL